MVVPHAAYRGPIANFFVRHSMKAMPLTEPLYNYLAHHAMTPNPVLPSLAEETSKLPGANMQIAPEQGAFMHILCKLIHAKRVVEVGCYTGYSAICMASALPKDGKLYTLDVNEETTQVAKRYFAAAALAHLIDLKLGPALTTLPALLEQCGAGSFDVMFIDADKVNMPAYYEWGLKLLRVGGLILADNVLWSGRVIDENDQSADTLAIRRFNDAVKTDERVDRVMLNVADGLFICRKR